MPAPEYVFFQMADIRPLSVRVNYYPLRPVVRELYANPSAAQFANLMALEEVRLQFGRLRLSGQRSWEELGAAALSEWQPQLIAQLHRCVGGAAPLRPIVNIGCGFTELVLAPVHTWRSHGLVLRGLRHGGGAFFRHVLVETLSVAEGVLPSRRGRSTRSAQRPRPMAQAMLAANPQRVVTLSE